jgi:hypothetical protein
LNVISSSIKNVRRTSGTPLRAYTRFASFAVAAVLSLNATGGFGTIYAQVQEGRIVGTVYDPQHSVVPNATVTVTDTKTNVSRSVTTGASGDYVITPLNPGTYSASGTAPGFQTTTRGGIELVVGGAVRLDFELRIGDAATQVEVTAEAPLLNTEAGGLGQVISNTQIVDLPLNGRSFSELGRLTPGSALLAPTGNTQLVRPENVNGNDISGVKGRQTSFLLDGVDITEQHQGGTWIQTSIDALQEFNVQQNAYSAEFARAGGAFNATTKSGGNSFHGDLFEFLRNDILDSRNFFSRTREILKRNQFGGTFGGPVWIPRVYHGRDKTFFFVSYEGERQRNGVIFNSTVPTAAQRNGDFGATGLNRIYDPQTTAPNPAGSGTVRAQFPGNTIPASRLSPQALFFNKYIPMANSGSQAVFAPSNSFDPNQVTLRLDQELTSNNKVFVRVSIHHYNEIDPAAFPALGSASLKGDARNIAAALTSNLRPNMIHEARFSYMFGKYRSTAYFQGQGSQFDQQAGLTGLEATQQADISTLPAFSWSGYTGFSGNGGDGRPKWQDRTVYEYTDNLTWIKGKHIVKFGARIHYFEPLFTDVRSQNGVFNFTGIMTQNPLSSGGTGDSFADWMLGFPNDASRSNPATWWGGYGTYWHFFVHDDLKLSDRLTVNLGLRYEYTPFLNGYKGQVATFDPSQSKPIIVASETDQINLSAQPAASVGYNLYKNLIQTSHQAGLPYSIVYPDKTQFAPRVGMAWRPFGQNTVIRGGYGIFYEGENTDGRLNFNFLPFSLSETVNADQNVIPTRTTANYFLGAPFGSAVTAANWIPSPTRMRMGYDQHWNFGFQRQFLRTMVVEADYVGTKGSFLQSTDAINFPLAGPGNIQARRPYPLFGTMSYNTDDASATYHALQAKLEKRLSSGMWFLVSGTYSKSLTRQNTPAAGGNYAWQKALTNFDVPRILAVGFGYELPFGRGKRFLSSTGKIGNGIIGGWQMQGIINFRSGLPFTPVISRDVTNTGIGGQLPNRIGSGTLDAKSLNLYFDKNAFVVPATYTYGNSGGGILRGDYSGAVNVSLFKQFAVTEKSRLQFRGEAFNLTNSAYFNNPNATVDVAAGGRVTSTSNVPRQIQFALKYIF